MPRTARFALPVLWSLLLAACGSPTPPDRPTLRAAPATLDITEGQPASIVLTSQPADQSIDWWVASRATWLRLSSESGTVQGTTTLTATVVAPTNLEPGLITGSVVFGSPRGTVTVNVNATLTRVARITISPTALVIPSGSDTGGLTLTNSGRGGGSWRATSSVSWLTLPTPEGFLDPGASVVVQVVAHRQSLPPGTSSGSISILVGGEATPTVVPVTVAVP